MKKSFTALALATLLAVPAVTLAASSVIPPIAGAENK